MLQQGLRGSIPTRFPEAFQKKNKKTLNPALCIYDKKPTADWVCAVLKEPVKLENSIPYYPDCRPKVMDQARVSFEAILRSSDFDENLVDADGAEIIKWLWEQN